ncbi:hypothetical protein H6P81_016029 [Aristolochia fimbriata]|uniref:Uncharacterized protein n=1 Tax=Aristolochia fimbriata TaxID=158543 RepID=A0AAV7E7U1_ARIFI|nr:hypothetical protein H6P81_016029 [Aristolochia fimbriata]
MGVEGPGGFRDMNGSRRDYLVRQAFLRSYKFTVEESFGEKVKRSFVELNEKAKRVFQELRSEMNAHRPGLRRALRFQWSKPYLVPAQCFTLGHKKNDGFM